MPKNLAGSIVDRRKARIRSSFPGHDPLEVMEPLLNPKLQSKRAAVIMDEVRNWPVVQYQGAQANGAYLYKRQRI